MIMSREIIDTRGDRERSDRSEKGARPKHRGQVTFTEQEEAAQQYDSDSFSERADKRRSEYTRSDSKRSDKRDDRRSRHDENRSSTRSSEKYRDHKQNYYRDNGDSSQREGYEHNSEDRENRTSNRERRDKEESNHRGSRDEHDGRSSGRRHRSSKSNREEGESNGTRSSSRREEGDAPRESNGTSRSSRGSRDYEKESSRSSRGSRDQESYSRSRDHDSFGSSRGSREDKDNRDERYRDEPRDHRDDRHREKLRHGSRSKSSRDVIGDDGNDQIVDKREGKENIDKNKTMVDKCKTNPDMVQLQDEISNPTSALTLNPEVAPLQEPIQQVEAPKEPVKKKFGKLRSLVSAVKTAQRLEKARNTPTSATFVPKFAKEDIVRSGHIEYQTLWASNEAEVLYRAAQAQQAAAAFSSQDILSQTGDLTVNTMNAPNESTLQCGCENINCPFCNLMMSIGSTDPTILQ